MKFRIFNRWLVVLAFLSCINGAHAGIITLQWSTTVSESDFEDIKEDELVSFIYRFAIDLRDYEDLEDLEDVRLDFNSLIDFSVRIDATGKFVTMAPSSVNINEGRDGWYLSFDDDGNVLDDEFYNVRLEGPDFTSNIFGSNTAENIEMFLSEDEQAFRFRGLFGEDESNRLYIDERDEDDFIWSLLVSEDPLIVNEVPAPSTLAIFELGLICLGFRRFNKQV
jgi:hypothetical protein